MGKTENHTGSKFMVEWRHVALIDRQIRSGSYPSAPQLARMLELSARTVKRRIEFMRYDLGAPIEYDSSEKGYYYSEEDWLLPSIKVSEGELFAVVLAERALRGLQNHPLADRLKTVFEKIALQLPEEVEIDPAELAAGMGFATAPNFPPDAETLEAVTKAVQNHRTLRIDYYKLSAGETVTRTVDPLMLRCMAGDWYLVGRAHETGYVSLFHAGRIEDLEDIGETFRPEKIDFDPDEYFSDSMGAGHGQGEPMQVRVRFSGWAARYVSEREWHPEQEIRREGKDRVVLTLPAGWEDEVTSWILSFGERAEVLGPGSLREEIRAKLGRVLKLYEGREQEDGRASA